MARPRPDDAGGGQDALQVVSAFTARNRFRSATSVAPETGTASDDLPLLPEGATVEQRFCNNSPKYAALGSTLE